MIELGYAVVNPVMGSAGGGRKCGATTPDIDASRVFSLCFVNDLPTVQWVIAKLLNQLID